MRKMFWGFGLAGVLTLCGVVAAAHHAARHPHSIIGRVLHGASHVATRLNPTAGFGPIVTRLENARNAPADIQGIPPDPVPVDEPAIAPTNNLSSAPIVIPDDEPISTHLPMPRESVRVAQHTEPVAVIGTTITEVDGPAAPTIMPPCTDDECEVLPAPFTEPAGDAEESEEGPSPCRDSELGDCREDPHHHHHYSGCPFTGRMYCPGASRTTCEPPTPARGAEEASEPPASRTSPEDTTAIEKVRRFKSRQMIERMGVHQPSVDTMEFRPSDRQLHDYGSGIDL